MPLVNPAGILGGTYQPINRCHYDLSFEGPSGSFKDKDSLESLSFPALRQSVGVSDYIPSNSQIPYAVQKNKISGDATFRFFDGLKGYKFWADWFKKVYDPEEDLVGIIDEYVGNGEISIYVAKGSASDSMSKWATIKIENCWPSSIGPDSLETLSDEQFGYSITLQIVDAIFELS